MPAYCALLLLLRVPAMSSIRVLLPLFLVLGCVDSDTERQTAPPTSKAGPLRAVIETARGRCVLELAQEDAPRLSANFANLVQRKFFDGLTFYRSSTVMRQAGNPYGVETRHYNPQYRLLPEFSPNLGFSVGGVVAMPLWTDDSMSDVRPTEFFITVKPQDRWTFTYPIFARVVEGSDVVLNLQDGDLIQSVRLEGDSEPLLKAHSELVAKWNTALDEHPYPSAAP